MCLEHTWKEPRNISSLSMVCNIITYEIIWTDIIINIINY